MEAGVDEGAIEIVEEEDDANLAALDMARAGDLVLVLADHVARSWKQIIHYKPGEDVLRDAPPAKAVEIPQEFLGEFEFDETMELIRDERGVRIAREEDD